MDRAAKFDLWASDFALMMALWFSCTAAVVVLRVVGSEFNQGIA